MKITKIAWAIDKVLGVTVISYVIFAMGPKIIEWAGGEGDSFRDSRRNSWGDPRGGSRRV